MNNVSTFNFNTNILRVIDLDGSPWFVAADACRVLGLVNPSVALKPLDQTEWSKKSLGQRGLGAVLVISESGLYKLIMRSNKPEAKAFHRLPAGAGYMKGTPSPWSPRGKTSFIQGVEAQSHYTPRHGGTSHSNSSG